MTEAPAIGTPAPVLLGKDGSNDDVHLTAYRGKVVIVTFWASSCARTDHSETLKVSKRA